MPTNQIKNSFLIAFVGLFLIGSLFFYLFFGENYFLNYALAFISTLLVVLISFVSYKKSIQNKITNSEIKTEYLNLSDDIAQNDESDKIEKIDSKNSIPFWRKLTLGSKLFFSIYRVLAYIFLILMLIWLINSGNFNPIGYIGGVVGFSIGVILFLLLVRRLTDGT